MRSFIDVIDDMQIHMSIMYQFRQMYINKKFIADLFDIQDGYLTTDLSTKEHMPLHFFVEYNNRWWFPILDRVEIISTGYDPDKKTGLIALRIFYDNDNVLNTAQFVKFNQDNKISFIHTYAASEFFKRDSILVEFDEHGNSIWLKTGYDMLYSAKAAMLFFESPKGRYFSQHKKLQIIVDRIKKEVEAYLEQYDK